MFSRLSSKMFGGAVGTSTPTAPSKNDDEFTETSVSTEEPASADEVRSNSAESTSTFAPEPPADDREVAVEGPPRDSAEQSVVDGMASGDVDMTGAEGNETERVEEEGEDDDEEDRNDEAGKQRNEGEVTDDESGGRPRPDDADGNASGEPFPAPGCDARGIGEGARKS